MHFRQLFTTSAILAAGQYEELDIADGYKGIIHEWKVIQHLDRV